MNKRLETFVKAALLGGLSLMFYQKIASGALGFYINARFAWLSLVAVVLFAALALTLVYRLAQQRQSAGAYELASPQMRLGWPVVALLAVPLALGLLIPARPLGAGAVTTRGVGLIAPNAAAGSALERPRTGPKNILDWLRDFSKAGDVRSLVGQPVDVVGFVYRDPRAARDQFWVSRFTVSCCVADASAIGLLVQADAGFDAKNDQWVRVVGKLGTGEFAGETIPVVLPEKIEPVDAPPQPYLYP